jgi:hypothetical protein
MNNLRMKKAYFNTTQIDLVKYNNNIVNIKRALTASEIDIEDVGPMYEIILPNGKQIEAFKDELTLIK